MRLLYTFAAVRAPRRGNRRRSAPALRIPDCDSQRSCTRVATRATDRHGPADAFASIGALYTSFSTTLAWRPEPYLPATLYTPPALTATTAHPGAGRNIMLRRTSYRVSLCSEMAFKPNAVSRPLVRPSRAPAPSATHTQPAAASHRATPPPPPLSTTSPVSRHAHHSKHRTSCIPHQIWLQSPPRSRPPLPPHRPC